MRDMDWRSKINQFIQQTEVNLSLVDGRPRFHTTEQMPPNHTQSAILSTRHDSTKTATLMEIDRRAHTPPILSPTTPIPRASEHNAFEGDLYMEVNLLKQQFLLFKENAEKTDQAQKNTISAQRTQIEGLKNEILLKSQVEEEMMTRVKKALREEIAEEVLQLKSRINSLESGLSNAGELAATHTSPLHARVEQLSHTIHSTVGQLRNEMSRVRATMDSFLGNATQAQSLGSVVTNMQQELGGIRSMVTEWNSVVGGLKGDMEGFRSTLDRVSGSNAVGSMRSELHVIRDAVDRNSGWYSTIGSLRTELDTLRETVERSMGHFRSDLAALQYTMGRPTRSELGLQPVLQNYSQEFVVERPASRLHKTDSELRAKGRTRGRAKSSGDNNADSTDDTGHPIITKYSNSMRPKKDKSTLDISDSNASSMQRGKIRDSAHANSRVNQPIDYSINASATELPAERHSLNQHGGSTFQRPMKLGHLGENPPNQSHHTGIENEISPTVGRLTYDKELDAAMVTAAVKEQTHIGASYDGANTEAINDKTDTEVIYDKTDTELHVASELVLDGSDTEALETDISFHHDRLTENEGAKDKMERSSLANTHANKNAQKGTSQATEFDSEFRLGVDKGDTDAYSNFKPRRSRRGYETDEVGKTEDDLSSTSFAQDSDKSFKLERPDMRQSVDFSAGHDSDAAKTEDDFSLGSFDGDSADENSDNANGMHELSETDHSSDSSYITAEPAADPSLEEIPQNSFAKEDEISSDTSVRRSNKLVNRLKFKKTKSHSLADNRDADEASSSDTDSSLMGSWNRAMGTSSVTVPSSLHTSRRSPISARKMYSDDEDLSSVSAALSKTSSFLTYEQFSSQFVNEDTPHNTEDLATKKVSSAPPVEIKSLSYGENEIHSTEIDYVSEESIPSEEEGIESVDEDIAQFPKEQSKLLAAPATATGSTPFEPLLSSSDGDASDESLSNEAPVPSGLSHTELDRSDNLIFDSHSSRSRNTLPVPPALDTIVPHSAGENTSSPAPRAVPNIDRKYKRTVSSKIIDLQKECGFFRTPPASLSSMVATNEASPPQNATSFVHVPISSPTRNRPRGPARRPPSPARR